jgi:hypothetical protein
MMPAVMRPLAARLAPALVLAALLPAAAASAQTVDAAPAEATTPVRTLVPFTARYEAAYHGKAVGDATLALVRGSASQWRVDLGIAGRRGMLGVLGLNVQQSTAFDVVGDAYRPLGQSTVRKGLFMGKSVTGTYDWARGTAQWTGDLKARHRQPVPLRQGDMSGLLINLAIVRDARPGAVLRYRFVEAGRVRDHVYQVAAAPDTIAVGELTFSAHRVARSNADGDETVVWVAEGVPTPVRILQREDGADAIDLRLMEYR